MANKKISLPPHLLFWILAYRREGGVPDMRDLVHITRNTADSWIAGITEPSRHQKIKIGIQIPEMPIEYWKMHHVIEINENEALSLLNFHIGYKIDRLARTLKISKTAVKRIMEGSRYISNETSEKIWEIAEIKLEFKVKVNRVEKNKNNLSNLQK